MTQLGWVMRHQLLFWRHNENDRQERPHAQGPCPQGRRYPPVIPHTSRSDANTRRHRPYADAWELSFTALAWRLNKDARGRLARAVQFGPKPQATPDC
jgi:hypothetical protein